MSILQMLEALKPGTPIEIKWRDASKFRQKQKLTRKVWATQVRTIGFFQKITADGHLILLTQIVDNSTLDGVSIPLSTIDNVTRLKAETGAEGPPITSSC